MFENIAHWDLMTFRFEVTIISAVGPERGEREFGIFWSFLGPMIVVDTVPSIFEAFWAQRIV